MSLINPGKERSNEHEYAQASDTDSAKSDYEVNSNPSKQVQAQEPNDLTERINTPEEIEAGKLVNHALTLLHDIYRKHMNIPKSDK